MADGSRNFIPIFDATLTAILIPTLRVESPGMLFNRNQVDLLGLQGQRVKLKVDFQNRLTIYQRDDKISPACLPPSSSGLGRSPFKATTGVRIPVGAHV